MAAGSIPSMIASAAASRGVPPALALAVAEQESGLNQSAIGAAGELGIFQLMPSTAAGLGVNPANLQDNIDGGTEYLAQMLAEFGDPATALAAYNDGPGNVARLQAQYGDDYFTALPASTQAYVNAILTNAGMSDTVPAAPTMAAADVTGDASSALDEVYTAAASPNFLLWGALAVGALAVWELS